MTSSIASGWSTILTDATGAPVPLERRPERVVSLVPSISETLHALGAEDRVVGVTDYCVWPPGAFPRARRVRGTKNPDADAVVALRPDLVLANREENRERDVVRLRDAGVTVHVSYPRSVAETADTIREIGDLLGAAEAAARIADGIVEAQRRASAERADPPVTVLCPIWRRPWMAIGEGCFAADLLATCGLRTLPRVGERYPRVDPGALRDEVAAVLLPSEPYPFREEHRAEFADWDVPVRLIDGALLTWHGPRTVEALRVFGDLGHRLRDVSAR